MGAYSYYPALVSEHFNKVGLDSRDQCSFLDQLSEQMVHVNASVYVDENTTKL